MDVSAFSFRCRNVVMFLAGTFSLVLMAYAAGFGGSEAGTPPAGVLEGVVKIDPLCPAEPCRTTPEALAATYATRKVIVYNADRSLAIKELSLDKAGKYMTKLAPGRYIVDINHVGMDRSADVPKAVMIEARKTTNVNISIDTGLR